METTTATTTKRSRNTRMSRSRALKKVPTAQLLRKKAECDARALRIVEKMCEPNVKIDWLLSNLDAISKCHMEDVAEERSLSKLCGYVLCDNILTRVIAKRYAISTLRNKVYDVDRVKNFCSYRCYSAAVYLMGQMLESPLWMRENEEKPDYRLMSIERKERLHSPPGVEVDLVGVRLPVDEDETNESEVEDKNPLNEGRNSDGMGSKVDAEVSDAILSKFPKEKSIAQAVNSTAQVSDTILSKFPKEKSIAQVPVAIFPTSKDPQSIAQDSDAILSKFPAENSSAQLSEAILSTSRDENSTAQLSDAILSTSRDEKPPAQLSAAILSTSTRQSRKNRESRKGIALETLTSRVEKSLREWITPRTVRLLRGETSEKREIVEGVQREERYATLCKKLNRLQIEEERRTSEVIGDLRPAPELSALRDEARGLELKVRAFFQGKTTTDPTSSPSDTETRAHEPEVTETQLPLLDLYAPCAQRRRILLDKLDKLMPDLFSALVDANDATSGYSGERCANVRALVSTFALTPVNVIFRTAEWTLVALAIVKLLGMMDPRTRYLLSSKRARMHVSMILMSYGLRSNYLDDLILELACPTVGDTEILTEIVT